MRLGKRLSHFLNNHNCWAGEHCQLLIENDTYYSLIRTAGNWKILETRYMVVCYTQVIPSSIINDKISYWNIYREVSPPFHLCDSKSKLSVSKKVLVSFKDVFWIKSSTWRYYLVAELQISEQYSFCGALQNVSR